ncbi:MAG: Isoprenyl transferase [Microgenomates group bacterium GW2011_GWC1_37_12b]|uniref:Isoprenyl transferase n=3 Tax=Candidatus Woeseibacteriota TaxID=1752722 RepID=A0A0G0PEI8_9BACT|nr:MAG: Isoprenyl transferase [Microgenomates group bacterium GW2011_GWC1_37_12b]KKQ87681.1 MAG: Isoprenyl transferase [Candidatus Woesebacteria bacterium GW2011_GWB1_38_8b]
MTQKVTLPKGTIVPNHIAVILDGNGRWARSRGLPVTKGHEAGAKAIKSVIRASREWGVHTLTIWGFSTENWKRPHNEKMKIFELVKNTIRETLREAMEEDVRFIHIGRKDRLPRDLMKIILDAEEKTKDNKTHILNVALDYGGREEILQAVKAIVADNIPSDKIDENLFEKYLYTAGQPYPNPDLFIRTSGELRTSGYLPWQMVYSEFYFEPDHLPDMTPEKLRAAIIDYSRRRRRFGAKDKVFHFKFKPQLTANLELNWWRLRKIPEGTKFRDYAINHLKEQFGLSTSLAVEAAKYLTVAVVSGEQSKWIKSKKTLVKFYKLIKSELKLAFEPSLAATLEVNLWQDWGAKGNVQEAAETENIARDLYSEIYRISRFQATKLAHLRVLANVERNMAERGMGDEHWDRAEDYLQKFYSALKERVA